VPARYYRDLILRLWRPVILCAILIGAGACVGSIVIFPVYQASSLLQVTTLVPQGSNYVTLAADRLMHTEAELATSDSVLTQVATSFPQVSESKLKSEVSATVIPNTLALQITVQDTNAAQAASIANAIANTLTSRQAAARLQTNAAMEQPIRDEIAATEQQITQVKQQLTALGTPPSDPNKANILQTQLESLQSTLTQDQETLSNIRVTEITESFVLQVAQRAQPASLPKTSRIVEGTLAGLASGLLLGFLLILGLDQLNWQVRSADEVASLLGVTVLGEIHHTAGEGSDSSTTEKMYAGLSDTCRSLVRSLNFLSLDQPIRTLAIISPERTNASNMLASSLALYLAASGRRTLLIDGHLVEGRQSRQFGIPSSPGLSNAVLDMRNNRTVESAPLRYARQPANIHAPLLLVLPAGTPPPNPDGVLASHTMERVLASLIQSEADTIILDTPPLLGRMGRSTSAGALLKHIDGILLVVDLSCTRKEHLLRAQQLLADMNAKVLGCVVSGSADTQATTPISPSPNGIATSGGPAQDATQPASMPLRADALHRQAHQPPALPRASGAAEKQGQNMWRDGNAGQ